MATRAPIRLPTQSAAAALVCALTLVLAALPARAEEGTGTGAVARLTVAERRVLDERVVGFAEMDPRRQERIAVNVIRLRTLGGDDRARFLDRVRALERHREEHGRLPPGLDHARNPQLRAVIRRRGTVVRGVGHRMWASLSAEARGRIKAQFGRRGRGVVEVAFAQRLVAARARAIAATEGAIEIPDTLSASAERHVRQLRAQAAGGDPNARLKLARLALVLRSSTLLEGVPDAGPVDGAVLQRIGERAEARSPVVFKAKVAELERAAGDPRVLERYARAGSGGRGASKAVEVRRLLKALEDARDVLRSDPRLRGPAERLERALRQALERTERGGRSERGGRGEREPRGGGGR